MAFDQDKHEALLAGAQRYLVKPVDFDVFCHTVAEMLNRATGPNLDQSITLLTAS